MSQGIKYNKTMLSFYAQDTQVMYAYMHHIVSPLFVQHLFVQRLFVQRLFIQSFSSNPIRLGIQILCTKTKTERRLKTERSWKYLTSLFLSSSLFLFWFKEFWIITLTIILIIRIIKTKNDHISKNKNGKKYIWVLCIFLLKISLNIYCSYSK